MFRSPAVFGRSSRRVAFASVALTASLALAGCTALLVPESAPASTAAPSASASPSASPAASATPTPTPTPTPDVPAEDPANPVPLPESAAPGTRLTLGDSMTVRNAVGVLEESEGWSILRYTVTGIERGDDSYLQGIDNAEEYQNGGSVYYVRGRVEVLALFGRAIGNFVGGTIGGVQSDGQPGAGVLDFRGDAAGCTGNFLVGPATVGMAEDTCTVALALPDTEIIGAYFYGDGTVPNGGTSTDPYWVDPIAWLP